MRLITMLLLTLALAACGSGSDEGDIDPDFNRNDGSTPTYPSDPDDPTNPLDPSDPDGGDGFDPTPGDPEPETNPDDSDISADLTEFRKDLNSCDYSDKWLENRVLANPKLPAFATNMEAALKSGRDADSDGYPDYLEQAIVIRIECDVAKGVLKDDADGDLYIDRAEYVLYHRIRELNGDSKYLGSPESFLNDNRDRRYFDDVVKLIDDLLYRVDAYRSKMHQRHSARIRLKRLNMDQYCNEDADNCVLDQFDSSDTPPTQFDFKLTFGGNTAKSNVVAYLPGPNRNAYLGMNDLRYAQEEIAREGLDSLLRNVSNAVSGKISYQYWHTELPNSDWVSLYQQVASADQLAFGRAWLTGRVPFPASTLTSYASEMQVQMDAVYAVYAERYLQQIESAIGGGASSITIIAYGWGADFASKLYADIPAKFVGKVKILSVAPLVTNSLAGAGNYCALRNDKVLNDLRPYLQSIPEGNVSALASSYSTVNHDFGTAYLSLDNPRNCILNFLSQSIVIPSNDSNPIVDNINGNSSGVVVPYNRLLDLIIGSPDTLSPRNNPEATVQVNMLMDEPGTASTHYSRDGLGLFGWWWEDNDRNQSRDYWNRYWLNYNVNRGGTYCWRPDPSPNRVVISNGVASPSFLFILRTPTEDKRYVWRYNTSVGVGDQGCVMEMQVYAVGQNGNLYRYDDAREPLNAINGYVAYITVNAQQFQ